MNKQLENKIHEILMEQNRGRLAVSQSLDMIKAAMCETNACAQLYDAEATREKLASYAHKQWSGWMEYLFSKCEIPIHHTQAGLIIPPWAVERWKRQIETPYEELSEPEKESDRKEADGMLEIICRSFI